MPSFTTVIQHKTARAIRNNKEIKCIQIGSEEVKWSLFTDNMILYVKKKKKNPKDSAKNYYKQWTNKWSCRIQNLCTKIHFKQWNFKKRNGKKAVLFFFKFMAWIKPNCLLFQLIIITFKTHKKQYVKNSKL